MDQFCYRFKVRLTDSFTAVTKAAMPDDRPSPIFSILDVLLNGGLLVWTFAVVLDTECSTSHLVWTSLGISHAFVNMLFAVLTIFFTRRRVQDGILLTVSTWRLFLSSPLHVIYGVYLLWEVVWMIVAAQKSVKEGTDACANHMNVQVGFYVGYLLAGAVVYVLTFATEGFRLPRWRRQANVNWYMKNEPDALGPASRSAAEVEEEEATEMGSRGSLGSDEPVAEPPTSSSRRPTVQDAQAQARAVYESTRGRHASPTGSRVGTRMRQLPSGALAWDAQNHDDAFTDHSTLRDWTETSVNGPNVDTPTERAAGLSPSTLPQASLTQRASQSTSADRATTRSVRFRE